MKRAEKEDVYWNKFGRRMQQIRKYECEMTSEELAVSIGMSLTFIRQIECGVKKPSIATLVAIARALNTSTDYLLDTRNSAAELVKKKTNKTKRQVTAV